MPEAALGPRSVSGHPVLDFVNTAVFSDGEPAMDVLRSAETFLAWSADEGLGGAAATTASAERALLRDAVRLRASMRLVLESIAAGSQPDTVALAPLQEVGADAVRHASPTFVDGRLTWGWTSAASHAGLWRLAISALDLLRDVRPDRIKTCPGCEFLLLDTTKNGRRRWCSMDDCGTQEKMRRYVAKRAGRRES